MLEKPTQKLLMAKGHHAALAAMGIILPAKRHVSIGDLYKPMVGDRDAMGVASQIMQHVFRSTERSLRINDPILAEQRTEESRECLLLH
jgi:hypothetical protein